MPDTYDTTKDALLASLDDIFGPDPDYTETIAQELPVFSPQEVAK